MRTGGPGSPGGRRAGLPATRAAAGAHLGAFGVESDAERLGPLLDDPDEVTRAAAAAALGKIFTRFPATAARRRSLPTLVDLLTDRSWWVRNATAGALDALADLGGIEPPAPVALGWAQVRTVAAQPLTALATPGTVDEYARQIAAYLLIWQPHPAHLEPLTAALAQEQRFSTRRLIFTALRRLHTVIDIEAVLPTFAAGHPGAAAAFADLDHPAITARIPSLLADPATRAAAAVHLGRFGTPLDAALLTALLDDPDELVRVEARHALTKLADRNAAASAGGSG